MSGHPIEILGQKFSYPSTWQGAFSVLVVCLSISFIAWTLEPDQIDSYRSWFGAGSDKQIEEDLVNLNKKLNNQVISLKADVLSLSENSNLAENEKKEILSKAYAAEKEINEAYTGLIEKQINRKEWLNTISQDSNQQQQQVLSLEKTRIAKQIGQFEQQQSQMQSWSMNRLIDKIRGLDDKQAIDAESKFRAPAGDVATALTGQNVSNVGGSSQIDVTTNRATDGNAARKSLETRVIYNENQDDFEKVEAMVKAVKAK